MRSILPPAELISTSENHSVSQSAIEMDNQTKRQGRLFIQLRAEQSIEEEIDLVVKWLRFVQSAAETQITAFRVCHFADTVADLARSGGVGIKLNSNEIPPVVQSLLYLLAFHS